MYWISQKRFGNYKEMLPLPLVYESALDALALGCATRAETQLITDLVDELRGRRQRLLCSCQGHAGKPLAELIPCKLGSTAFFRRLLGGPDHNESCLHYYDHAMVCGDGACRTEPVGFEDFIFDSEDFDLRPLDPIGAARSGDRQRWWRSFVRRSRASLASLQTLCLEAAGLDVLFDADQAVRLPFDPRFAGDRIREALRAHQTADPRQVRIADVLLVDPPSLRNLVGQVVAHARKNCPGAHIPVSYALVVVDSISIDRESESTLVTYRRGRRLIEVRLPGIIAVTGEHVRVDAGPYLLAMRVICTKGTAAQVQTYARQVVSRTQLTEPPRVLRRLLRLRMEPI